MLLRSEASGRASFCGLLLVLTLASPRTILAQDADGDGVADNADAFPCDPSSAGMAFAPAEDQHGLILFEDLWPEIADEDFNDVAIAYNFIYRLDPSNRVTQVQVALTPLALGGLYDNGLALHLPIPRSSVQSVTLSIAGGEATALTPSSNDAELTVVIVDELRSLFGGASGVINARSTEARRNGSSVVLNVQLSTPVQPFTASAPHDLFIFRSGEPSREIHRREYSGSSRMNAALFGTQDDASAAGRWYVDQFGLPSALVLPLATPYPSEQVGIAQLFPNIIGWATSGGTTNQDFYASAPVQSAVYRDSAGLGALTPAAAPRLSRDRSCVATDVTFSSNTTVDASNVSALADQNWIVPAGVTVTIDYDQPIRVYGLDLRGTMVPAPCTLTACRQINFEVVSDAVIHPTGRIDASGRGYPGSRQSGNGSIARTRNFAVASASYQTGGSHGGFGGRYGATVDATYDDVYHPRFPGGGGTGYNNAGANYWGGDGGGVIRMAVAGTLTLNGTVVANGGRGGVYDTGGAGGSIWIDAATIHTTATGGVRAQANGAYGYYAGGGGGRVAIYGATSGWAVSSSSVEARGGTSGLSGTYAGGGGTIVHGVDAPAQANLLVYAPSGESSAYSDTRIGAFGNITGLTATVLTTDRTLEPGTLVGRTLLADAEGASTFTISANTANTITIGAGSLSAATAIGRTFYVTDYETRFGSVSVEGSGRLDVGMLEVTQDVSISGDASVDAFDLVADRVVVSGTTDLSAYRLTSRIFDLSSTTVVTAREVTATTATLVGSSVLTGWDPSTARVYPLTIVTTNLTVGTSARIRMDALGYLGSRQGANGSIARTLDQATAAASYQTGGSHGGYGGRYGATVAAIYGNPYFPNTAGTGGTGYNNADANYWGGTGGGVLRIIASGTLTLDGRVSANGARGGVYDTGGAGGSIWIDAGQLTRNTTGLAIEASGAYGYYAGGGGGRVAVHYGALSGFAFNASSVQVYGATSGLSGTYSGGSGTIVYRQNLEANGRLLVSAPSGRNSAFSATRLGAFGAVTGVSGQTFTTSAPLVAGDLAGRQVRPDITRNSTFTVVSNTANTITVQEAGLAAATAVGRSFSVLDHQVQFDEVIVEADASLDVGELAVSGALTVRDTADLVGHDLSAATMLTSGSATLYTRTMTATQIDLTGTTHTTLQALNASAFSMLGSAVVTGWAPTISDVYPVTVTTNFMNVAAGARLTVDALGYLGSRQLNNGSIARTLGHAVASASHQTGGSHGGYGGRYGATVAAAYGNLYRPITAGTGGSGYNSADANYWGGNGGGVIRLIVAGDLTLDGRVTANGGRGGVYDTGGAGGSVWIDAGTMRRTGTGGVRVEANGAYGYYAGGGGGRIAIHYGSLAGFAIDVATLSAAGATSGLSGTYYGGSGTIVGWPTAQASPYLLLNAASGVNSAFARTPIGAFGTVSSVSGNILVSDRALEPGALVGFSLVPDAELETQSFLITANSATTITVAGSLTTATFVGRSFFVSDYQTSFADVTVMGNVTVESGYLDVSGQLLLENTADLALNHIDAGTFIIRNSARLYANRVGATNANFIGTSASTVRLVDAGTVDLADSALITAWAPSTNAVYALTVLADTMTMTTSSRLDVSTLGYLGSRQSGNGGIARTHGNVYASASYQTGGSHGGLGGRYGATATPTFGSALSPVTFGAGGTSYNSADANYWGGNGGGAIRVMVSGAFNFAGRLVANGGRGGVYDTGGAAGSVWVTAGTFNGAGGRLETNGAYGYYAGGSGGRIAVDAPNVNTWSGSGATATSNGGTAGLGGTYAGQPGSISVNGAGL